MTPEYSRRPCTRWILVTAIVLTWLGPLSVDAYSPSLPLLVTYFDASRSTVQLTLTALLLGLASGQLLVGPISDVVGRRGPVTISLTAYVFASIACMLSWDIWVLVAARFVQGMGAAGAVAIARAVGRDLYQGRPLARFYSQVFTAMAMAPMVGPVVGAALMNTVSWRAIFAMIGCVGIAALALTLVKLPETLDRTGLCPTRENPLKSLGGLLASPFFAGIIVVKGLAAGALVSYLAGASFLLQETYELNAQEYSLAFAASMIGLMAGTHLNTLIVARTRPTTVLGIALPGMLLTGLSLTIAVAGAEVGWVIVLSITLLALYGLVAPNLLWLGMAVDPWKGGSAAAVIGASQHLFGAITAPILGVFGEVGRPMTVAITAYTGLACLGFFILRRHLHPPRLS